MLSSGFFDAVNGDRSYSADHFSALFDGLVSDGIYSNIGESFAVVPGGALSVKIKSGHAWFNHTWTTNNTDLPLDLELPDLLLPRIDAVILEVDTRLAVRKNAIKILTGEPNVTPSKPIITKNDGLYQYALAYIDVAQNTETITVSNITNVRGIETPYVSIKLPYSDTSALFQQMEQRFQDWFLSLQDIAGDNDLVYLATAIKNMTPIVNEMRPKLDSMMSMMTVINNATSIV